MPAESGEQPVISRQGIGDDLPAAATIPHIRGTGSEGLKRTGKGTILFDIFQNQGKPLAWPKHPFGHLFRLGANTIIETIAGLWHICLYLAILSWFR